MMTAALVIAQALQAWRPPPRLELDEWADRHYYLSAESAAEPGRWHTLPYQREPMKAITDPAIEQITFMKSSRVGYTKMLNATIGYHIEHDPTSILVIQPTLTDAKGFSKEEVLPMLRDCPVLDAKFPPHVMRKNSLLHMRFSGGLLQLVGARSPASFRRVSRRIILGDETDGYPASAGVEGDPVTLAWRRSEWFWNRKGLNGSTPTIAGVSRIEKLYFEGDQRRYYVPCTQCGHMDYLVFRREAVTGDGAPAGHFMRWTKGQSADAHFVCGTCGGVIEEKDKRDIVARGAWRPHNPDASPSHRSYHLWAAYSHSPNATWAHIAAEFEKALREGPEQLKTFVNTVLGETWKEQGEAPDWEPLYYRRELYERGTCPDSVLFLTAGVDVQRSFGLVFEVVGWGRGKRSWSIDAAILPGDPADLSQNGPWAQVDALLNRTFRHARGVDLRIAMLAVDSGDNTNNVYTWARRYPLKRVIAIKGDDRVGILVGPPSKVDVTVSGRKVGYRMWRVSGNVGKSELYGWLRQSPPTDEGRALGATDPIGFCRFPQYGEDYFKALTAEQLVPHKTPSGFTVLVWELIPGRENHFLDCRIYARAAAALQGLDRFQEPDWTRLERAVGYEADRPPPVADAPAGPADGTAAASTTAPRAAPALSTGRKRWIERRPSGWIRRK